ncbi:hypothetical protein BU15DRAFT_83318 [Melanogaster broomeanus]|nr:hypothetical protein BU15DRAFT_83318 [Melanogaster broomeanus]
MDRLQKESKEFWDIRHTSREPLERQMHSGFSVAEAGPSLAFAEHSSPPLNPGEGHGVHPTRHHNSQWDHTKAASQASSDTAEATSVPLGDSRVQGASLPGGASRRQEQTEEIHRRPDDEAAARQKAEAKVDQLEKKVQELRDIISLASRGPLERQMHPGLSFMEAGPSTLLTGPSCSPSNAVPSTSPSRSSTSSSDPEGSSPLRATLRGLQITSKSLSAPNRQGV